MYYFQAGAPRFWSQLAVIALLALVGAYAVRYRRVPAAKPFAAGSFFALVSVIALVFERAAVEPAAKFQWFQIGQAAILPAVTATTFFVLEYVYPGRWIKPRYLVLGAIPCVIAALFILSDTLASRIWVGVTFGDMVQSGLTGLAWVMLAYGNSLVLVNLAAFSWLFIRSPQLRLPVVVLATGQLISRGLYASQYFAPELARQPDLYLFAAAVPWVFYAVGFFGFRILDPLPAAFATAVQQMREGMVVFDVHGRILDVNPAAGRVLDLPTGHRQVKTWRDVFSDIPQPDPAVAARAALEASLGPGRPQRRYVLELTPLADQRGVRTGLLVLLHDVTEQREAQARAAEQQWAQAVLLEREHLAHELHDGISQDLAFLNLQAQAAQTYAARGDYASARTGLDRLAEVARGLLGDTRELIGNLLFVSLPIDGFYTALRQSLERFEGQTGLAVMLQADEAAEAACCPQSLPADTAVQLLRIVQEALANIRKHAGQPGHVAVSLARIDGALHLSVEDDGVGFDPVEAGRGREHFGLQVMQRRAARFGGQLTVRSAPGEGVRVTVCVPLRAGTTVRTQ